MTRFKMKLYKIYEKAFTKVWWGYKSWLPLLILCNWLNIWKFEKYFPKPWDTTLDEIPPELWNELSVINDELSDIPDIEIPESAFDLDFDDIDLELDELEPFENL